MDNNKLLNLRGMFDYTAGPAHNAATDTVNEPNGRPARNATGLLGSSSRRT